MRDIAVIVGLTLLVLGGAAAAVTVGQQPSLPLGMEEVKEGLYVITGSGGNVAARVTSDSVVLVDDKFERNHEEIVQRVGEVTDRPITYVISTHHHGDHVGGNPLFAAHAEIIAHANVRVNMLSGGQPAAPRVVFRRTMSLFVGDIEIRAHHFGRGHTDGDAVVEFPDLRTIHTGDLFVEGAPFIDYLNGGSSKEWVDTLGKILELDFDTVIPGHGPIMVKADVLRFRDKLVTLRARMSQLIDQGVPKEEAPSHLHTDDLAWPLAPDGLFVSRSLSGFYDEMSEVSDAGR
jgi:glyoxylase-like metal-dependent hydrolase (beta-lactamase superfamily II)